MLMLRRTDVKLLTAALKSNGGGITAWNLPIATVARMLKASFIKHKPNHLGMLTITASGKAALNDYCERAK